MPIKTRHREALARLGLTVEERYRDSNDGPYQYPEWQTIIKRGDKTVACIVTHGCHTDSDRLRNKYQLRRKGKITQIFRLKREAMAEFVRSEYRL